MATGLHKRYHQKLQIITEVEISTLAVEISNAAVAGSKRSRRIVR
jgi:hypothetical protein